MDDIDQDTLVAVNRAQLLKYDEKLVELEAEIGTIRTRRAALAAFLTQLTGEAQCTPPVPIKGGQDGSAGGLRHYRSRTWNRSVVDEALRIVLERGQPMTVAEILETHPMKGEIGDETLYRLMYNRVISEKLYSFAGAFWPASSPIPAGWNISLARRGRKAREGAEEGRTAA